MIVEWILDLFYFEVGSMQLSKVWFLNTFDMTILKSKVCNEVGMNFVVIR